MKILLYSLLHKNYQLLGNITHLCDRFETLIVDNTPVEERQSTPYNTFIPADTNSSYGKAIYESSKFIDSSWDYVLWSSQDIVFPLDFNIHFEKMLKYLEENSPGILACGLNGSGMSKYGLHCNNIGEEFCSIVVNYSLKAVNGLPAMDPFETQLFFVKPDILRNWGSDIKTCHIGYGTGRALTARVFTHQIHNDFIIYARNIATHDITLSETDKQVWLANRHAAGSDNLILFLKQQGIDTEILIERAREKNIQLETILWNTGTDILFKLQNNK